MSLVKVLRPRAALLLFAALLASGCAPRAVPLAADHPANPDAETGRLAGPPSALRAGVAQLEEPAPRSSAAPAHDHSTHEHGGSTAAPAPAAGAHQHGAETTPAVNPVTPTEPAVPDPPAAPDPAKVTADLLAMEMTAYDNVKPVVEKYCASCHTKGRRGAKAKILEHFETTTYPFGGHHAMEVGKNVRKVLGIGGGKPTMPKNKPGIVQGDELALFAAWADAFDASHVGGAHEGHGGGGGHDHGSMNHGAPAPANTKPAAPVKTAVPARFDIAVTSAGFEPNNVTVPRGEPVILRFERRVERTCGTEVVMTVDGQMIEKDLPLNKPVELAMTFRTAGTVKYSCSMDMIRGTITVQ